MRLSRTHALEHLIAGADRRLARAARTSSRFTRWRLAIFLSGVLCTLVPFKLGWYHTGNTALGVALVIFLIVAGYHSRLESGMHRLRLWRGIKQSHLDRLHHRWDALPVRAYSLPDQHLYAADLDLVGPNSLLRLLDTSVSSQGRERLTDWLLSQPPDEGTWRDRQALIKELVPLTRFRDRLRLASLLAGEVEVDGRRIRAVLQSSPAFPVLVPGLIMESLLAVTTLMLLVWLGEESGYWAFSFSAYALLYMLISGNLAPVFGQALSAHDELNKLTPLFRLIESRSYAGTPRLGGLCKPLVTGPHRPSVALRRLARVCHALSVKAHPLFHLILNALGPWDLFWTHRFGVHHRRIHAESEGWMDALAQIEAASALAGFAHLHPTYYWPTLASETADGAMVRARELGHPLIPASRRVTNDLELIGHGRILLITGSNMSGKSTFLRTLGINICLAQAGAPVCATAFEWAWVRLACCIRIDDSLESGLSFFYAEVKRLKRILDLAQDRGAPPVLFLIDEIFKGTNNRERLIGSRAFIHALALSRGFGLVTTHDLELTELERAIPTAVNAHFEETVEDSSLHFDYRLRPGPCPTTNALRIMALEGLPVPEQKGG
jgi:hypothetical protein